MDARIWASAKELLADVADLPIEEQRAYIERHCADPASRAELLALLESPARVSDIVDRVIRLRPGSRLGPYEIVSRVGAGGMGEVYRARDPRLGRDVAIKVLPARVSSDPRSATRFIHEARAIAALNHPHICAIYDVGEDAARPYFVMELLDGESLHRRLARGGMKGIELLDHAIALADALAAAHDRGIIHRDLKPSNVIITARGELKVLDFGLAKQVPAFEAMHSHAGPLTAQGSGVGTLAYMSPEQMRGEDIDARTDLFSLGAVLYEMATARAAFDGPSSGVVADAVLNEEPPPVTDVVADLPPSLAFVIAKALEKDRSLRYQDARTLRTDLSRVRNGIASAPQAARRRRLPSSPVLKDARTFMLPTAVAACLVAAAFAFGLFARKPANGISASVQFPIPKVSDQHSGSFALSPDGSYLAYVDADAAGSTRLYLRSLDSIESRVLNGTEGAQFPFWSPDSRVIGYSAGGVLRKIGVSGGPALTVCPANGFLGGTWNREGVILFSQSGGLYVVRAEGGTPSIALAAPLNFIRWPQFLPDGRRYLYFESGFGHRGLSPSIRAGSLGTTATQEVLESGYMGRYAAPGYLLSVHDGDLVARRLDLATLRSSGEQTVVAQRIGLNTGGNLRNASFAASDTGSVVFGTDSTLERLQWVDRSGILGQVVGDPAAYLSQELSPDGTHVALEIEEESVGRADLWVEDLSRPGTRRRLTHTPSTFEYTPRWSPDGVYIAYSSTFLGGTASIRQRRADGAGDEVIIAPQTAHVKYLSDWWPTGGGVLVTVAAESRSGYGALIGLSSTGTPPKPPLAHPEQLVKQPRLSRDGRWIAYVSEETGHDEVYVERTADGHVVRVSSAGGQFPSWRSDSRELFYIAPGGALVAVALGDRDFLRGDENVVFRLPSLITDVAGRPAGRRAPYTTRDGKRFLVRMRPEPANPPLTWVLNWPAGLAKK